jgi:excinuclease ABC subunit C
VKSSYRRFNIKGITPGDDVAAIQQVIQRRYQQEHPKIPDLILIDGGPAQLAVANQTLIKLNHSPILLIGVAKGASRKPGLETLYRVDQPPINLPPDSPALHLIQQIRDEAHRFAITGHRQQRDKKRITSVLEKIPGIGAKRRRELLLHFGGIQALTRASLEELEQVIGISQSLAKRIYTALHHDTI